MYTIIFSDAYNGMVHTRPLTSAARNYRVVVNYVGFSDSCLFAKICKVIGSHTNTNGRVLEAQTKV